ncbi:hypothetical protein TNCV_2221691 [Trichonephila clavipes]|nr:hypothetical protein TNCV_2221691 [Trichonephila clavipes]
MGLALFCSQNQYRWCCVVVRRRDNRAQVSSSSLEHDSKLRGPSPRAILSLNSVLLGFAYASGAGNQLDRASGGYFLFQ